MFYEAAKNTSTTALRTAPRRREYLSCFLLLGLFRALRQGGDEWSKVACFTFRGHFLVCYCILNSNIAFKTLFYRTDTDYWVCLCLANTWLGQCPLGCHAVFWVFYDYPSWRTEGSPFVPQVPGYLKTHTIHSFLTILNYKTVCACRSSIMDMPPVPNQFKTFKLPQRSFG